MKQFKILVLAMLIVMSMIPADAFAENKLINVTVDGVPVKWTDAVPYVDNSNRTMVPLSPIANAMFLEVQWDPSDKTAMFFCTYSEQETVSWGTTVDIDGDGIKDSFMGTSGAIFTLNDNVMSTALLYYEFGSDMTNAQPINNITNQITMDTAAVMKDKRIYAPIKYLAEFYDYKVSWDKKTNTVILITNTEE